ncbi:MAG: SprT family zinc-dependent metalloprotease [Mariprofundaceae bacterium]|nr:SprT family zinc-dependent metalloprotease [Mariprofundaceae bacterium]
MMLSSFRYGEKTYEYTVQLRSRRKKSIAIHVLPDGSIEVNAPMNTLPQEITLLVHQRAGWIVRHVEQAQQRHSRILPREYTSGETHLYLGDSYALKVVPADVDCVTASHGFFMVQCSDAAPEHVKRLLNAWYKQHAQEVFAHRLSLVVEDFAWLDSAPPMAIRAMRKQWGSCSSRGRIHINRHLVKAPVECLDYVLAHELCHLQEYNHSKRFYALLDRHHPGWRAIKSKLDEMADMFLNE